MHNAMNPLLKIFKFTFFEVFKTTDNYCVLIYTHVGYFLESIKIAPFYCIKRAQISLFDQLEGLRVGPIFTIFGQLLAKNMLNAKIVQNYLIPIQNNLKQRQFLMFWLQKTWKLRILDVFWFPQLILLKNGLKIQSNIEWDTEIIHIHMYIWDRGIKNICMTRFQLL